MAKMKTSEKAAEMKPAVRQFTAKQRKYVDCFDGNVKRSARMAGISHVYARELHAKTCYSHVQTALRERETVESNGNIATRQERQQFWTKNMRDESLSISERRKFSELMGKSELDFGERRQEVRPQSLADIAALMYVHRSKRIKSKVIESAPDAGDRHQGDAHGSDT